MDGRQILGGTDGRYGLEGTDGTITWDCLPASFRIQAVTSKADTVLMLGRSGNVWARLGMDWKQLPLPVDGDVMRAWVDDGELVLLTDKGEIAHSTSVQGPYTVVRVPDRGGRWRGMDIHGDTIIVVGQRGAITTSFDGGATWLQGPPPRDTLAWNTVHRTKQGQWFVAGDGACVAQMRPPFTEFIRVDTLFRPDHRDPLGAERRDGMDEVISLDDGITIVGGRTYPSRGFVQPDDHALFVLDSGSTTWRRIAFVFSTGIEPTVFFDCKVIALEKTTAGHLSVFTTVTFNGGSLTMRHAIDLMASTSRTAGIIPGGTLVRRDSAGLVRRYESVNNRSVTSVDDSTIILIREYQVMLGEIFASPSASDVVLLRLDASGRRVASIEVRGPIPCQACTHVRAHNGSLFVGGEAGTYYVSADTGRTWTPRVIDSTAGRVRGLAVQGELRTAVVGKPAGRPDRSWAYAVPMVSSDAGAQWHVPDVPIPDGQFARADFMGITSEGAVIMTATTFDTATLTPTQRFVRYNPQTRAAVDILPPSDLIHYKQHAVLSALDPSICAYASITGADTTLSMGTLTDGTWTTTPILINSHPEGAPLNANKGVSALFATRSVAVLGTPFGTYLSTDLSSPWAQYPGTTEGANTTIMDAVELESDILVVGPMGLLHMIREQPSTSVTTLEQHAVPSPVDGIKLEKEEFGATATITDVAGRQHSLELHRGFADWATIPPGVYMPGVYAITIGTPPKVRRQTVLITR